jgi:DNA-directed RNA polymerase subunit RPC12/RpoP
MRENGTASLFQCSVCGKDIDWWLFSTAEELKQYQKDLICPYCKYPEKYKRQTIIKRRRR